MKHGDHIEGYPGTMPALAEELGNLRYDALASFLSALAAKLARDSTQDAERGRTRLAAALQTAACEVGMAAVSIETAWAICAPHMGE